MGKFKVIGLENLKREIDKAAKDIERGTDEQIKKLADEILSAALARVPAKLGKLKASSVVEKIDGGYVIAFNATYAPYVEFGTGQYVEVPNGLEEEALQFYVNGKGHQPAQPFLFPAFLARKDKIVDDLEDALKAYIKSF